MQSRSDSPRRWRRRCRTSRSCMCLTCRAWSCSLGRRPDRHTAGPTARVGRRRSPQAGIRSWPDKGGRRPCRRSCRPGRRWPRHRSDTRHADRHRQQRCTVPPCRRHCIGGNSWYTRWRSKRRPNRNRSRTRRLWRKPRPAPSWPLPVSAPALRTVRARRARRRQKVCRPLHPGKPARARRTPAVRPAPSARHRGAPRAAGRRALC